MRRRWQLGIELAKGLAAALAVRPGHPAQHGLQLAPVALLALPQLAKGGQSVGVLLGQRLAQALGLHQRIQPLNTLPLGFGQRFLEVGLGAGNGLAVAAVEDAKQRIAMRGNALAGAVPVLRPGRFGKAAAQALRLLVELIAGVHQLLQLAQTMVPDHADDGLAIHRGSQCQLPRQCNLRLQTLTVFRRRPIQ